jgi:hypothetical protein
MTAGLNLRIRIYRIVEQDDDEYGGAVVSGTVFLDELDARFQALKPSPLLLQQGLEVTDIFRCIVQDSSVDFREYDEVEIVWPTQHRFYGERFRIDKIQRDGLHPMDRRSFVEFTLTKMLYSRSGALGES